jgi:hypothetical protein
MIEWASLTAHEPLHPDWNGLGFVVITATREPADEAARAAGTL